MLRDYQAFTERSSFGLRTQRGLRAKHSRTRTRIAIHKFTGCDSRLAYTLILSCCRGKCCWCLPPLLPWFHNPAIMGVAYKLFYSIHTHTAGVNTGVAIGD